MAGMWRKGPERGRSGVGPTPRRRSADRELPGFRAGGGDSSAVNPDPRVSRHAALPAPPCHRGLDLFTVALADRKSWLLVEEIDLLRAAVRATRAERPFGIDAWVAPPDHLHCVWTLPAGDADYPTQWRLIKTRFSRELPLAGLRESHFRRQERGVWQRRFWDHHLRGEADYTAHVRYCWVNLVKHGLVDRPEDWPYSSIHRDGGFG